jgi:hypothetical protein
VDVARSDVMADADTIADAETGQGIGKTCSLDGLQEVADGAVKEGQVAVEFAGGDQSDQGLDRVGGSRGWSLGVEFAGRELPPRYGERAILTGGAVGRLWRSSSSSLARWREVD